MEKNFSLEVVGWNLETARSLGGLIGYMGAIPMKWMNKFFGKADNPNNGKTSHEWYIWLKENGIRKACFNIYDYNGEKWHIGGNDVARGSWKEFVETVQKHMSKYCSNSNEIEFLSDEEMCKKLGY